MAPLEGSVERVELLTSTIKDNISSTGKTAGPVESPLNSPGANNSNNNNNIKTRMGGSTMKTAKVWRYFDQLPSEQQAATCKICYKKIKATNSRFMIFFFSSYDFL